MPLNVILSENNISDADMTKCESMRCILQKNACAKRWRLANSGKKYIRIGSAVKNLGGYYMCKDCAQGEAMARDLEPTKTEKMNPWEGHMEDQDESKKDEKPRPKCTHCGINDAIFSEKTGRVTNGLCRDCYSEKRHASEARKKLLPTRQEPMKLNLDLTDYPELANKLIALAKNEMRPPHMQAIWIINDVLNHA